MMKKSNLGLIYTLILFFPVLNISTIHANEDSKKILPIVLNYAGIGSMYGLGYSDVYAKRYKFLISGVVGDLKAVGTNVTYQPKNEKQIYNFAFGHVNEINALTYFQRGSKIEKNAKGYGQKARLNAMGFSLKSALSGLDLKFNASFVSSQIDEFTDDTKKRAIELPDIHLTAFHQLSLGLNVANNYYFSDNQFHGTHYALDLQNRTPSAGYSGDSVLTLENHWFFRLLQKSQLRIRGFYSTVLAVAKKIPEKSGVRNAFSIECNQINQINRRSECEKFEEDIVSYIAAHNRQGTARPLGGSEYLPAYVQNRFRASNSAFAGIDLTHHLSDKQWLPKLYISQEIGFAHDDTGSLADDPQYSLSGGLKWVLNDLSLVAQYATGAEGEVFSFTARL